jgi:hypothetical protein
MNLLQESMEECTMQDKISVEDGYGGFYTVYQNGAVFNAAVVLDNSMQSRIAEKEGVTALYTVTTEKNINLQFHDIFKRNSDQKIFRILSDGDDNKTPSIASLNMRQVSAEEWVIPDE